MAMKPRAYFVSCLLLAASPAMAVDWQCTSKPVDGGPQTTREFQELDSHTLLSRPQDINGERTRFQILENSDTGLIAISHFSHPAIDAVPDQIGLVVVVLNKKTGAFQISGFSARTQWVDINNGSCTKLAGGSEHP